jgi:hypothetical protein
LATNNSTGAVLFSKTYNITNVQVSNSQAVFLLNIPLSPNPLSADISVRQTGGAWYASVMVTRRLDITGTGTVNIGAFAVVASDYGSTLGTARYNPSADLIGTGTVNIVDVSIMGYFYGATVFY